MKSIHTVFSENFFRRFRHYFAPHLAPLGIDNRVIECADIEIPGEQYLALWEAAGKDNPSIGLELGSQTEVDDFGALGHAIHCAPTIEKALLTLQRFIVVFAQGSSINYGHDERSAYIEYQAIYPIATHLRQDAEFTIASLQRQLSLISNHAIKPTRIDFEHDRPSDLSRHKQVFQCPIHFNQPTNRLYFSSEALQTPLSQSNERLYKALEPYLEKERINRSLTNDLIPQITHMVATGMSSGVPSIDDICKQLNLSKRTLQRRLKDHGMVFSSLIEDVRRELAFAYLKNSNYSITEVSLLLGYTESASFTRAFKRWAGQSPQQYCADFGMSC
ncbi:MAG: AraC family transcriptional regulator [Moraxellaceae bacterium]|nr:AraC family transcriptional regulator [Moraxellaceae bacterium]